MTSSATGSSRHSELPAGRSRRACEHAPLGALPLVVLLLLLLLLLPAWASAQTVTAAGTQIVLPDGSVCELLPETERFSVNGATAAYACGEDGSTLLVGGLLERGGRASVEAVRVDSPLAQPSANEQELIIFDIRRLVLASGAECLPLQGRVSGEGGRQASYACQGGALPATDAEAASGEGRWMLVGPLATGADGAVHATLARGPGTGGRQGEERVAVALIDGSLELTEREWVLASFGTGEDPPLAGAAPTLTFGPGSVGGNASCNSFFAPVSSRGPGELRIGQPGSTLMACQEELMSQELRFLQALEGVSGYELVGDTLYLFGGAEVMTFEPQAAR